MPEELPEYVSTAGVSVGPELATGDTFNQYAKIFGDIEQVTKPIAQSFSDQSAKESGMIAGENPGFKPEAPIGESSKIFNQAGLASNKLSVMSDVDNKIVLYKNQAMGINSDGSQVLDQNGNAVGLTPQSLEAFNSNIKGVAEGTFSNLPDENRQAIKYYMSAKATMASSDLLSKLNKKHSLQQGLSLYQNNETGMNSIADQVSTAYSSDPLTKNILLNSALSHLATLNKNTKEQVPLGSIGQKAAEAQIKQNNKRMYEITTLAHAHSLSPTDAMKFADDQETNSQTIAHYGAGEARAQANLIRSTVKNRILAEGVTSQKIVQDQKNLHAQALNGQTPDPQTIQDVENHNIATGKSGNNDILHDQLSIDKNVYAFGQLANSVRFNELGEQRQKLLEDQKNISPSDPNYAYKLNGYEQAYKTFSKTMDLRTNDASAWVQQSPGYQAAYQRHIQNPANFPQSSLDNYIVNAQIADKRPESTIRLNTIQKSKQDASQLKQMESSGDWKGYVGFINNISSSHGPLAHIIYSNIQNDGKLNKNLLLIHESSSNPATSPNTQGLAQSMFLPKSYFEGLKDSAAVPSKIKPTIDNMTVAGTNFTVNGMESALHDQGVYSSQFDRLKTTASTYASYLVNTEGETLQNATTKAVQTVFSGMIGVDSFNGRGYTVLRTDLFGNQVDPDKVKAAAYFLTNDMMNGKSLAVPDGEDRRSYKIGLLSKMTLRNKGSDGFALVDGSGNTIGLKDSKGKTTGAVYSYRSLTDQTSPLNNEIRNAVVQKYGSYSPENLKKYANQDLPKLSPRKAIGPADIIEDIVGQGTGLKVGQ